MRDVQSRILSELMKNSRRSDRELAKAAGVSQPTVSRMISKLEKEGYIREYAMVPNFRKLGFELISFIFVKLKKRDSETIEKLRKNIQQKHIGKTLAPLLVMNGIGSGMNGDVVIVTLHRNYSEYTQAVALARSHPFVDVDLTASFLVSLEDKEHFQELTFSAIAKYLANNPIKT